ncbi:MAG: tetratricopeptide repeat protein [Syntrophaceae bacterium]|nr:tetratricopeptide repeat protein [Syntrophaceae bacterium]
MHQIIWLLGFYLFLISCATVTPLPEVSKAYHDRGKVKLVLDENYEGAIDDFTKAIEFNPKDADLYVARGLAYLKKGEAGAARGDFNKAVSLNPDLKKILKPFLVREGPTRWWFAGGDEEMKFYLETDSVRTSGDIFSFLVRVDRPGGDCDTIQGEIDCRTKRRRWMEDSRPVGDWEGIRNGSVIDAIAKKCCP